MANDPAGWNDLANAVILQAVEDYRRVCRSLRRDPRRSGAAEAKASLEAFFASRWFRTLTAVDGNELLEKIREEENTGKRIWWST